MEVNQIRRANLLALFKAFVEAHLTEDASKSIAGLDRAFAAAIEVHNTAFSGLKSGARQLGPTMARQIEAKLHKPKGWMDIDHGNSPVSEEAEEQAFLKLCRRAYRKAEQDQRNQLLEVMQAILTAKS